MVETIGNVVVTSRLTKIFRDFWLREKVTAVADLDLEVRPREVLGLLGPNGSGKSTTIKMILGLLFPTRGRITIYGRAPTDVAVKARIGFLPEETYLYPFLDARETLDFYGQLFHQPRPERRRRTDMLLEMVGLTSVAYRRVGEYSKGMQRRIGLAQALINDPDLLILDEPTSGMDPVGTRQFKDLIRTLAARGKTIILSSHLLGDVEDVCDRICILYGGVKRAMGRIDELLAQTSRTQLTTDRLDERTLARLQEVLAADGKGILEVCVPRDRLESLFLRMVKEAQDQNIRTGGALAGGAVAEFLREGPQAHAEEVIKQLVAATQPVAPEPAAPEPVPQAVAPQPSKEVLEELVAPASSAAGDGQSAAAEVAAATEPSRPPPAPTVEADRSVIDELLSKNSDESRK